MSASVLFLLLLLFFILGLIAGHSKGWEDGAFYCPGDSPKKTGSNPHWEMVLEDSGEMCHVRWSEPDAEGRYLWVAHYPGTPIGIHFAETQAERFNKMNKCPWEFREYRNTK